MAKTYGLASEEVWDRFRDAMNNTTWGERLIPEEIRFEILCVTTDGPAALTNGALARIKVVGAEERSRGGPDCRILLDLYQYQDLENDIQREAVFAHELFHIEMTRNKKGVVKRDDYDRPRFKMKKDHWYITGFHQVWSHYRENSIEQLSYDRMTEAFELTSLQFEMGVRYPKEDPKNFLPLDKAPEPAAAIVRGPVEPTPTREELKAAINEEFAAGVKEREAELEGATDEEAAKKLRAEWVEASREAAPAPVPGPAAEVTAAIDRMRGMLSQYNAWRDLAITTALPGLGTTATIIWSHDVRTVGELVLAGGGMMPTFADSDNEGMRERGLAVTAGLARFRETLNPEQKADFDALAAGQVGADEPPKPKKERKPRAAKPAKVEPISADEPEAEAWRYLLIGELGLPEKVAEDMTEGQIETMGELVALTSRFSHTLPAGALLVVNDALDRFDSSLSDAQRFSFRCARLNQTPEEARRELARELAQIAKAPKKREAAAV